MPIQFDTLLKAILEIKIMKKEPTFPKLLFVLHYQVLVESSDTVHLRIQSDARACWKRVENASWVATTELPFIRDAFHQIPIAHILSHVGYLKALI